MFDFEFFQNDILVNKYEGLFYKEETFVTDDLLYNHKDKKLIRNTDDYSFTIDFKTGKLFLKLSADNYEGNTIILISNVVEDDNIIKLIYQIDENEPINKIVITRRNPWRTS